MNGPQNVLVDPAELQSLFLNPDAKGSQQRGQIYRGEIVTSVVTWRYRFGHKLMATGGTSASPRRHMLKCVFLRMPSIMFHERGRQRWPGV